MSKSESNRWVAVPIGEEHRVGAGYWLARTREELEQAIAKDSAIPRQWTCRRVRLAALKTSTRQSKAGGGKNGSKGK